MTELRIVVIGGGFGGLASAARLAKLGHQVTLLERSTSLGGALQPISADGFTWDAGPTTTLLPAVIRDLFRKTGRPLERELELEPLDLVREHRFEDRTVLRLPSGSRAAQIAAFDQLGDGAGDLGASWSAYVDAHSETWEVLRRGYLEQPWDPALSPRELTDLLGSREMLHKRLRRDFKDERLRLVATALDIVLRDGRAVGVCTANGDLDADAVVCAIDPRRLPALAGSVHRTMPAIPPVVAHVGLDGDLPDLPHEVVLHGDPMLVVRTGGTAPEGGAAWTIIGRGRLAEDVLRALARHKVDVRTHVVTRIDRSPRDLVDAWGGSPLGVLWQGRATVRDRLGPTTPVPGVYAAGAHATPGSGLPFVGLSAALVAQEIGPA
jgi:phytoene dehydrogenase-like protein